MLRQVCIRRLLCPKIPGSPFVTTLSPDHIGGMDGLSPAEDQVAMLLEELTRERLRLKAVRDENERLRSSVTELIQREAELADLETSLREKDGAVHLYKMKNAENELRLNELQVKFRDYKEAVEVETVKLKQTKSLPLLLASLGSGLLVFCAVKSKIELEKQQFKFLQFELENVWRARVQALDARLAKVEDARDQLRLENANLRKSPGYLTVWGKRVL